MSISVSVTELNETVNLVISGDSTNIGIDVTELYETVDLSINESRDAYQLAVASGYTGTREEWLALTTNAINSSLLSGKGYLITSSDSGVISVLESGQSGYAILSDPSQIGGLRWGPVEGGGAEATGVTSFNTRDGAVTSASGDYADDFITNTSTVTGGTVKDALDSIDLRIGATGQSLLNDLESTGSNLFNLANEISGALNFYLTGGLQNTGSSLSLRIDNSGGLFITSSGEFNDRLKNTGDSLISLNSSTSGDINFYLTGGDSGLSSRLESTGSNSYNLSIGLSGEILDRLEQTGQATQNIVDSVFGREGDIVGQSGDYSNTGITNESNVIGATTADALNTLDQRLTSSGALGHGGGGGAVSSVFGRNGVVVAESGDYSDTGITNTSNIEGNSVFEALNSIHSRIDNSGGLIISSSGEINSIIEQTGLDLIQLNSNTSGDINFYLTGGDAVLSSNLESTGSSLNIRLDNSGNLFINSSGELNSRIDGLANDLESTGSDLFNLANQISGELNIYLTGGDANLSTKIENTGSSLNLRIDNSGNLFIVSSGEFDSRISSALTDLENTGSNLYDFANQISGQLNFYLTGGDSSLSSRIQSTGSSLHARIDNSGGLLINSSGEFNTRLKNTGDSLISLNSTTSGALNFYLTGGDSAVSNRIQSTGSSLNLRVDNSGSLFINSSGQLQSNISSTGSNLYNLTKNVSGEINFRFTGADAVISNNLRLTGSNLNTRINNTGALITSLSGSLNTRLSSTGSDLINLNSSTSGAINFYLTGGDAILRDSIKNTGSLFINSSGEFNARINTLTTNLQNTGSNLYNFANTISGELNFYSTGNDASLSSRIESTGSSLNTRIDNSGTLFINSSGALKASINEKQDRISSSFVASETLFSGNYINIWDYNGVSQVRKTDANDSGRFAVGYINSNYNSGDAVDVEYLGLNKGFTGLSVGKPYYLSLISGNVTESPLTGSNQIFQNIGTAVSPQEIFTSISRHYIII